MLREVEASLLLAANARTDNVNQVVTIRLPCTKTDPAAASVERSWGVPMFSAGCCRLPLPFC